MIKIPKETVIAKIKEKTGLSESEIDKKIKEKLNSLSGLISEEGAAHIVANQLGVKLVLEANSQKIKDIIPGLKNVDVTGKIVRKYELKEFESKDRKGKLISFLLGDETGVIRAVAWNDKADLFTDINENEVIKIEAGYSKENRENKAELHLGDRAKVSKVKDVKIDIAQTNVQSQFERKKIDQLNGGEDNIEILGTIVQTFDPKFFEVCPNCAKRARQQGDLFVCDEHGSVTPNYSYVMNLVIDDGSANIRAVLWKNQTQRLLLKTDEEILSLRNSSFEEVKTDLLGKIVKLSGRCTKNAMFERLEFVVQLVYAAPDPEEEIARLNKKLKDPVKETPVKKTKVVEPKKQPTKEDESGENIEEDIFSLDDLEKL
ncbi:MAG: OB-fold nucleic acid binding domain-containing protein [archaeon]